MQTGAPVVQSVLPSLQGSAGLQLSPAVQESHEPPALQTLLAPHGAPARAGIPVSVHLTPFAQSSVPVWQGLPGTQEPPGVQGAQSPSLQTMPAAQSLPLGPLPEARH